MTTSLTDEQLIQLLVDPNAALDAALPIPECPGIMSVWNYKNFG